MLKQLRLKIPVICVLVTMSILVLLVTSCAPRMSATPAQPVERLVEGGAPVAPGMVANEAAPADTASSSGYADATGGEVKQMVIKNGDLSIVVEDPRQTMTTITNMAVEMGGFVVTSDMSMFKLSSGEEVPQGSVTIRVPAARMEEAFDKIKKGAGVVEVQSEHISGQDVTKEYTDLASRKRNLEDAEARLREIMNAATTTEDVLAVHNQLTQVREQIEVIQGQMQYYEQSSSFSAINVTITSKTAIQPLSVGGWQPVGVARDAIQALLNTTKVLVNIAIWLVLFILPVLVMIVIPVRLIWLGLKRLFGRGKKTAVKATEVDQADQPAVVEKKDNGQP